MSRAKWKNPFVDKKLLIELKQKETESPNKIEIKTFLRHVTIIPKFIGVTFHVHNGKNYSSFKVTENMVGHKLGEFSPTRKTFSYKKKKRAY